MNFNEYRKRKFIDKTCEHHPDCQLFLITLPGLGEVEHCEDCAREAVLKQEDNLNRSSAIDSKLADTYVVFDRDSIVSDKLKAKSLDNYKTDAEIDQRQSIMLSVWNSFTDRIKKEMLLLLVRLGSVRAI